jgi:hypothetical protein
MGNEPWCPDQWISNRYSRTFLLRARHTRHPGLAYKPATRGRAQSPKRLMSRLISPARFASIVLMKAWVVLLTGLVFVSSAFAQGRVSFRNTASTSYYIYTNNGSGGFGLMSGANGYRIGLYASTIPGATESSLELIGLATNSATLPGRFLGPSPYALPGNYPASTPIVFQIRGWSFAGGLSWNEALAGAALDPLGIQLGSSALGTVTPTPAPSPAGELWGTSPGALTSGFVIGIPEPSSTALAALGALALLMNWRRNSTAKKSRQ